MRFCLPDYAENAIREAFKNGELSPEKLNGDSKSRRELLEKYIGKEAAKGVSLLFEKKLLLKNQEKAMYDFAKEVTGMAKADKAEIAEKIRKSFEEKDRRVFSPTENESFLGEIASDIYSKKYKTDVSLEEAQTITELSMDAKAARDKAVDFKFKDKKEGLEFGAAEVARKNYIAELKLGAEKETMTNPLAEKTTEGFVRSVYDNSRIAFNFIADNTRAVVASVDNSLWFRQGYKVFVNPQYTDIWAKNFVQSWKDIGKTLIGGRKSGDAILDAVRAEIFSRPEYLKGTYELGKKLDIGTGEEAYPTSAPSKIPVFGRLFKASEVAYEAGAMRMRADIADRMYKAAEKAGVDFTDAKAVGDINEVINSMTGRGKLWPGEKGAKLLNKAFFSVKFFKSNLDILTAPAKYALEPKSFARQQAALNTLSAVVATGLILGVAKAFDPDSVDFDSTSSAFGKIKIGKNVYVDVTGGVSGLVVLASRIIQQKTKNPKTGVVTKFGEYGAPDGMSAIWNFTENKFSPIFSVLRDVVKQKNFQGNKPTVLSEAKNLVTPILVSNLSQLEGESGAIFIATMILDAVGFNANPNIRQVSWDGTTSAELKAFEAEVGEKSFKEANKAYNEKYNEWLSNAIDTEEYRELSNDDKKRMVTSARNRIKKDVFMDYGFIYRREKKEQLPDIE